MWNRHTIIKVLLMVLILILINNSGIYSQTNFDSLEKQLVNSSWADSVNLFIELSRGYVATNTQKAIDLGKRALTISERHNEIKLVVDSYNCIGRGFEYSEQNDLAMSFYRDALTLSINEKDNERISDSYSNIAAIYYQSQEYDSSLNYNKKALTIREKIGNPEMISNSLNNIGGIYIVKGQYKEAFEIINKLLEVNKLLANKSEIASAYGYLGYVSQKLGVIDESLDYYLKELKLREEMNDNEEMDKFLTNIATIYFRLGGEQNLIKAEEYYQKAYKIIKEKDDIIETAISFTNLGNVNYALKKYKKALNYYQQSLDLAHSQKEEEIQNQTDKIKYLKGKAVLLNNIGLVYKNLGDYQKALDYCVRSIKIKEEIGDDNNLFYPLTSLAEINLKLYKYDEALRYLNKAQALAIEKKDLTLMKEVHYLIYEVYYTAGNFRSALEHHKKYTSYKDSLVTIQKSDIMTEMQAKYESDMKDKENLRLKEAYDLQRNYFIVISALILLILFVTIGRYRSKQRANKLLSDKNSQINQQHKELEYMLSQVQAKEENLREANATKDKFFSIIAHDLKNPLHAITLSSDLLYNKHKVMNQEQMLNLVNNINTAGSQLSNLLDNLLQWSRTQSGKISFQPQNIELFKLIDENFQLMGATAKKKKIRLQSHIPSGVEAFADKNMLNTVILNLLSNAIKFSYENSSVRIEIKEIDSHYFEIKVIDNGVGIKKEDISKLFRLDIHHTTIGTSKEKGTGLGLILCKEFIEINGGRISVESEPEKGASFIFTIPRGERNLRQLGKENMNILNLN